MRLDMTLAAASVAALTAGAAAAPIEVLLSNVIDHPTADVPGQPDLVFRNPLAPFTSLYGSPSGSHWILKAFGDDGVGGTAIDVIVVGGPGGAMTVAREGDATPNAGTFIDFVDSDCGINDAGAYAYGARTTGGPSSADEVIIASGDKGDVIAVQEGDAAPGLVDPAGAKGDEIFGNSLNSVHRLNDGTVAFRADQIDNVDSDFESALYQGAFPVLQEGTVVDGVTIDSTIAIGESVFQSDSFGENWIVEADIMPGLGSTEAVIVNNMVMVQDGDVLGEFVSPVDAIFGINMGGGGDWMARGENLDETGWVLRNGALLLAEGDPVPGSDDGYGDGAGSSFFGLDSNISGDYIVGSVTDNADAGLNEVITFNNEKVVVRKGDPVDLDGNGKEDDDAFIADIDGNYMFLSDDFFEDTQDTRMVYFRGEMRNGAGVSLGDAVMRRLVNDSVLPTDPADLDGDGVVGPADLALLLGAWGPCDDPRDCPEDLDGDGTVGPADLALLLGSWG